MRTTALWLPSSTDEPSASAAASGSDAGSVEVTAEGVGSDVGEGAVINPVLIAGEHVMTTARPERVRVDGPLSIGPR